MPSLTLRQRLTWAVHLWKALTRQHHLEMLSQFRPFVPSDGVVLDVGAHAGQFTKLFAGMVPMGQVYAFEPGSYALSILRLVKACKGLSNVTVYAFGLSDSSGICLLNVPIKRSGSVGFGLSFIGDRQHLRRQTVAEEVTIKRLDDVVSECGIDRVDFIKLDVEGSELRMLVGASETLLRFSPVVYVELSDETLSRRGDSVAKLTAFLNNLGYTPTGGSGSLNGNQLFVPLSRRLT